MVKLANAADPVRTLPLDTRESSTLASFPPRCVKALRCLVNDWTAAPHVAKLPKILHLHPDDAAEVLAELQALDLVTIWTDGPGNNHCVCLTTRAAALMGVELRDDERAGMRLQWCRIGEGVDRGRLRHQREMLETDAKLNDGGDGFLAILVDPKAVDPADALVQSEALEAASEKVAGGDKELLGRLREKRPPRMTLLLGLGLSWPVETFKGGPCPGCLERSLSVTACCLLCHRSGADHLIEKLWPDARPRPRRRARAAGKRRAPRVIVVESRNRGDGLAGGIGAKLKTERPARRKKAGKEGRSFDLAELKASLDVVE